MENVQIRNLLIGATGSVASLKIPSIINSILELNTSDQNFIFEIKLIVTDHAKHFFDLNEIPSCVTIYDDEMEWSSWRQRGDPVVHIELGKWADLFLIAPLDANTLGKMSSGICDNLLTCTTRAWSCNKPLIFCPAMNTRMWEHHITSNQIQMLKTWGHIEIPPIEKTLICGDKGVGAMAEVTTIIRYIKQFCGYEKIDS